MRMIVVNRDSSEAVYLQIARQIRTGIAAGDLEPGRSLPTVRRMASDLGVNLNTVARAYRQLEEEGFVVIQGRRGAEVAAPAERPHAARGGQLAGDLRTILHRMKQAGFSVDGILGLVKEELSRGSGETPEEL